MVLGEDMCFEDSRTTPTIYRGLYDRVTVLKLFDFLKITVPSQPQIQL